MLAFLFGVLPGGISGYLTYGSTAQMGLAVGVGIVVFLIGWLLGVFFFGDATDIDIF